MDWLSMCVVVIGCCCVARAAAGEAAKVSVIPRPRAVRLGEGLIKLAAKGGPLGLDLGEGLDKSAPVQEGLALLMGRLKALGVTGIAVGAEGMALAAGGAKPGADEIVGGAKRPALAISRIKPDELAALLAELKADEKPGAPQLEQAYVIQPAQSRIELKASGERGLYYGLVTLCQLIEADKDGTVSAPAATVADWPELAFRLAKTSASNNPPEEVARFAAWLPLLKMSAIGLQYHGGNSKKPDANFTKTVETLCPRLRKDGVLESIVYFCPFRGARDKQTGKTEGAYDFSQEKDRAAYADYLRWIVGRGADGVEVDYNDWPGSREVPISDVLDLACEALKAEHPDARVLYCPPLGGKERYGGMATKEMGETLAKVPAKVWPLWTGMPTLITKPLTAKQAEEWARIAGRKPVLWVNRVSLDVASHFAREVAGADGAWAFQGELLPKDLGRLFEGVHFNADVSKNYDAAKGDFKPEAIAYLATAADYVWNPGGWDAAESCRRAKRFVEVMAPLLGR